MFGGDGKPHEHESGVKCTCRDATTFIKRVIDSGAATPEFLTKWAEPPKTQFPAVAIERAIGMPMTPFQYVEDFIWYLWVEIRRGSSSGGMGPAKITWHDLNGWVQFTGISLADWVVQAILGFDQSFLESYQPEESSGRS